MADAHAAELLRVGHFQALVHIIYKHTRAIGFPPQKPSQEINPNAPLRCALHRISQVYSCRPQTPILVGVAEAICPGHRPHFS